MLKPKYEKPQQNWVTDIPWTNDYRSGKKSDTVFRCKYCPVVRFSRNDAIQHAANVHGIRPVKVSA